MDHKLPPIRTLHEKWILRKTQTKFDSCILTTERCVDDGITQVLIGMGGQDVVDYPYTGAE